MGKGRKPTPNQIKKIRGTDQPVRMKNEIDVKKITSVKMPRVLVSRRSKRIFKEKANQLLAVGILTELDLENLALYSSALDMAFNCLPEIEKGYVEKKYKIVEGEKILVGVNTNPYIKIFNDMLDRVNKLGSEFGFSPVSRMKFISQSKDDNQGDDDFD